MIFVLSTDLVVEIDHSRVKRKKKFKIRVECRLNSSLYEKW